MKKNLLSIRFCRFCSLGFAFVVSVQGFAEGDAAAISLGKGVDLVPSMLVEAQHDDNVTRSAADEISSWVTLVSPSLALKAEDGVHKYNLLYTLAHGEYASSKEDSFTDHLLDGSAEWEMNSRNRFSLFATFLNGHDPRGTAFSQGQGTNLEQPDTFDDLSARAVYSFGAQSAKGRLDLEIGANTRDYDVREDIDGLDITRTRDRNTNHGTATFAYKVGGRTELLAEVTTRQVHYDVTATGAATLNSNERDYLVGVTWEGTAKTTGTIKLGRRTKDFDAGSRRDFSGPRWEAGIRWEPRSYSAFDLNTARYSEETNGTGDFIDAANYKLAWHHKWLERLTSTVSFNFKELDYEGTVRQDEQSVTSLNLRYKARRWLFLSTGVVLDEVDSNLAGFSYDRVLFTVGFQASL